MLTILIKMIMSAVVAIVGGLLLVGVAVVIVGSMRGDEDD